MCSDQYTDIFNMQAGAVTCRLSQCGAADVKLLRSDVLVSSPGTPTGKAQHQVYRARVRARALTRVRLS